MKRRCSRPSTRGSRRKSTFRTRSLRSSSARRGCRSGPTEEIQADAVLIGLGGSDRRYFRVRNGGKTAVLMECKQEDPDYERHLVYTRFFEAHSVPVPGIIDTDDLGRCALFEDLGDTSLYSYLKLPHDTEHIEDIYQSVLDILVKLHSRVTLHVDECPALKARVFDYEYLRWETGYFLERFVVGLKEKALPDGSALNDEFHRLAQTVDASPKGVIHRDFQCQNIIITAGGIPRLIDFQGARMAPPAYDVASILWDPYCRLAGDLRDRLMGYYVGEMRKAGRVQRAGIPGQPHPLPAPAPYAGPGSLRVPVEGEGQKVFS